MKDLTKAKDRMKAAGAAPASLPLGNALARGKWRAEFRDPEGNLLHVAEWENLIVNEGLDQLLDGGLVGAGPWYIGLTDGSPTVAAEDTMGTHDGWGEVSGYDEINRQNWTPGTVANQTVDNSGAAAEFTITNNSTTIGGAFLTNNATKDGSTGKLFAAGAFEQGDVTLSAGSTITVVAEFSQAAAA
ncbi:hypothetical protein ACJO2E_08605 [Marinobacter sp. M1N3S26]|uniref:hypothetical protein n=1 Tax=Marinobacter sp. M1N3S26 TaxID=3382299 RepID=UPI00387AA1CB